MPARERDRVASGAPRSDVKVGALFVAILLALAGPSAAQPHVESELDVQDVWAVYLDDLYPGRDGEDVLEVQFRALTEFGEPVEDLSAEDVAILQDGSPLTQGLELQPLELTDRGVTAVLLLDVSPAMAEIFQDSQTAALALFDRLAEHDQFAIVSFAGSIRVVAPFGMERTAARAQLAALTIEETPAPRVLFDAIHESLQLVRAGEDLPRRSLVIVLSDGVDGGTSTHDIDQIVAASTGSVSDPSILVYAIGYRHPDAAGLGNLREIASRTGGDYMEDLTQSYQDIWDQSDWSQLLRVRTPMDGASHEITLKINGRAASRSTTYPGSPISLLYYVAAGGALLLLVALVRRRGGAARHLTIQTGSETGRRHRLRSGTTEIGRANNNDIVVDSINVSGRHAELTIEGGVAQLRDRGSTNGTFVNGVEVKTTCALHPGDEIRLGDVEFLFS